METYTYQEEVEYEYKILNILLKNKGFDTIARKNMNRKQTGRYDAYNLTYGNRPELFGAGSPTYSGGTTGSIGTGGGTGGSGGGFKYDIPSEALSDEKFARMIEEAEKYLGKPYVWGGSSPSTSFDCSGFVCWVINNCGNGWSVGRTTANGLRGKCSYVSPADAQPGDLIFFEKTYNTVGASHVGIYVGNGMMIHCGDPISYTSINESYMENEITEEQYHAELMDYEEAHRKLNERLTAIMEDTLVWERALSLRNPWIQQMAQYKAPEELDRNFVKKYIEQVTVTLLENGQAKISLTMKTDEWKKMLDRIEMEGTDDGAKE